MRGVVFPEDLDDVQDMRVRRRGGRVPGDGDGFDGGCGRHTCWMMGAIGYGEGSSPGVAYMQSARYIGTAGVYPCFDSGRGNFFSLFGPWESSSHRARSPAAP
jgi:hypothetical protein